MHCDAVIVAGRSSHGSHSDYVTECARLAVGLCCRVAKICVSLQSDRPARIGVIFLLPRQRLLLRCLFLSLRTSKPLARNRQQPTRTVQATQEHALFLTGTEFRSANGKRWWGDSHAGQRHHFLDVGQQAHRQTPIGPSRAPSPRRWSLARCLGWKHRRSCTT